MIDAKLGDLPFVRKADVRDEPEIMELCLSLHRENALFHISEDKVRAYLRRAFANNGAIIGVIGPIGRIEAAIYLMISDYWYSDQWHLEELFSYVKPEYRRSNNAKALINFAQRCSDELSIPAIIGIISNERTKAKIGLYQRQLGTAIGAFFVYNAPRTGTVANISTPATQAASLAQQATG